MLRNDHEPWSSGSFKILKENRNNRDSTVYHAVSVAFGDCVLCSDIPRWLQNAHLCVAVKQITHYYKINFVLGNFVQRCTKVECFMNI